MGSKNSLPEVKSMLKQTHDLATALSIDLSVAGILLSKEFISTEVHSRMQTNNSSLTPLERGTILAVALRSKIEVCPRKFTELYKILSEQTCTKEVAERLYSTYENELAGQLIVP